MRTLRCTAILWDLDGTIADSAPSIMHCMARTLEAFGLPVPEERELRDYIGPPILDTFRAQGFDDAAELNEALAMYRQIAAEYADAGTRIYPGVGELVHAARAAGLPQSTATSKIESSARRILDRAGLTSSLDFVTGANEDETRSAKQEVVAEALHRLRGIGADLSRVVMIGDRHYDVAGARANGVPAYYVHWGYGAPGEEEGAADTAQTPRRLAQLLGLE